jgi:hypothetical protein
MEVPHYCGRWLKALNFVAFLSKTSAACKTQQAIGVNLLAKHHFDDSKKQSNLTINSKLNEKNQAPDFEVTCELV